MKVLRAILGGIMGALAMSLAMFLMRSSGIQLSLEALLGSLIPQTKLSLRGLAASFFTCS